MASVRVRDPQTMTMMGLLLSGLLEGALEDERSRLLPRIRGDVWVRAGQMWVTLRFTPEGIEIVRGREGTPVASVEGEMRALVEVTAGRLPIVPFLAGRLRARGAPLLLLRLLRLFKAG